VIDQARIQDLDAQQLRQVVRALIADVADKDAQIAFKQATIDKLTHEMAVLKRLKFAAKSEAFNAEQRSLLEETIDTDLAALAAEIVGRSMWCAIAAAGRCPAHRAAQAQRAAR
jgi:transposase